MNKEKIKNTIKEIKLKIDEVLLELSKEEEVSKKENLSATKTNKFEELKILLGSNWPEAVLQFQIVDENSEEDKMDRGEGLISLVINEELENKKFLDFGCGEGHCAKFSSTQETSLSIGYDIIKPEKSQLNWETEENNLLLTTNLEKVKEKAPYDIILIYDVLDHTEQDPVDLLTQAKSLLSDQGKIYLRCHPWCGRHGGHLYRKMNKAFVHVVFSDDELKELGLEPEKMIKVKMPMKTYEDYIKAAGLKIESKDIETQDVEDFFEKTPIIRDRLKQVMNIDNGKTFPKHQLSQCFHDYILTK